MESIDKHVQEHGDRILNDIESVTYEPALVEARRAALEYNEALDAVGDASAEDLQEIVEDLDSQVGELMDKTAVATGWFRYRDAEGDILEKYLEDVAIYFKGFIPGKKDFSPHGTDFEMEDGRIFYYALADAEHEGVEMGEGVSLVSTLIRLDSIIEFQESSPEMSESWLRYSHPDLIEGIDEIVLGHEGIDEAEITTLLGDFHLNRSDFSDDDEANKAAVSVYGYINRILPFDDKVPYSCTIEGEMYVTDDGSSFAKTEIPEGSASPRLFSFVRFEVLPEDLSDPYLSNGHRLYITMEYIKSDYDESGGYMVVPVSSIKSAKSVRRAYYS